MTEGFRFSFAPDVPIEEVEASLLLALFATESLHGEARTRLEAEYALDREGRRCTIDASTPAGTSLVRVFLGFVRREFGADSFRVERILPLHHSSQEVTA